jgi:hypothetical protein
MSEERANGDNLHCLVRWSRAWPDKAGYWWLYQGNRTVDKITLVRAAFGGDGKIMVMSPAELFYRQQQTGDWMFARAILPDPPNAESEVSE